MTHPRTRQAPVVSFADRTNAVATIGWSVTVSGVSFGTLDATPSSRVGLSSCQTVAWASATSVVCMPSGGQGVGHDVVVSVCSVAGTTTRIFSFDGTWFM